MKSRLPCVAALFFFSAAAMAQYRVALPGYRYKFPQDYFNHPDFQTEWWYYTGNVKSADGHRFGFELTFFRQGVNRDAKTISIWEVRDLYFAHLALSDLNGGKFLHAERTNRAGPGIAGVSEGDRRIWNSNWQIAWRDNEQILQAIDERFALHLTLRSAKAPVAHGQNGVSQKAEGPGHASHYISLTRLNTQGEIELGSRKFQVIGTAWMDHEFFTHQLEADQVGWDWMSIQLQPRERSWMRVGTPRICAEKNSVWNLWGIRGSVRSRVRCIRYGGKSPFRGLALRWSVQPCCLRRNSCRQRGSCLPIGKAPSSSPELKGGRQSAASDIWK